MEKQVYVHKNIINAIVDGLQQIIGDKKQADRVIEKILKSNKKWGSHDRRFIAETLYEIVRWQNQIQFLVQNHPTDYWHLTAGYLGLRGITLPPWPEISGFRLKNIEIRKKNLSQFPHLVYALPEWLYTRIYLEIGERLTQELAALNEPAKLFIRVNTLKTSVPHLQKLLENKNIASKTLHDAPHALWITKRINLFSLSLFKEGLFEVQDAGSQCIASYLPVAPGMRVVDACAGAGGKTLHLSAIMQNKGKIIALDVERWKLDELQKRARRAGCSNIETRHIETQKTIKKLYHSADALLLDVPCSGLGVLRRNPDTKWKLEPGDLENLQKKQAEILNEYTPIVKPRGYVVYATCSILPSENENQIKLFLQTHQNFTLLSEHHQWPSAGYDGFYMALLQRTF